MSNIAAFKAAGMPVVPMAQFKVAAKVATAAARAIASSGGLFLRLGRDGIWIYGPDNVEVQEGSQWAINPYSMAMGFCAWGKEKTPQQGKLLGEKMALITDAPITHAMLHNIDGVEWQPQVQFDAICLTGEDVGTGVRYKAPSVGGRRAFAGMMEEVSRHADGDGLIVPVVVLMSDSYMNKTYGKTYVPVFEVAEWKAPDDTTLGTQADGEEAQTDAGDAPTETTQQRTRRPAATAAAANAEAPPATRRTRRGPVTEVQEVPAKQDAAAASPQPAQTVDRGAVVRRRRAAA